MPTPNIYARRVRVRSDSRRVWILGPEKTSSPDSCLITAAWSNCTRSNKNRENIVRWLPLNNQCNVCIYIYIYIYKLHKLHLFNKLQ